MVTENVIAFFVAVIAWNAFLLNLLIVPFFRKAETLHKDYITDGVLDAALSFIETDKLIPGLANMFVSIREAQHDRRKTPGEDELQEMLQQIDYIPHLKVAQEAMDQKNELESLFDSLQNSTGRIWKLGLLHVIIMLCVPASQWVPAGYDLITMTTAIIVAIITFSAAVGSFLVFEKQMRQFLDLLKQNR
jgi:hypothetical protein